MYGRLDTTKMKHLLKAHVNASCIFEVETRILKVAIHGSDDHHRSSFAHSNEPRLSVCYKRELNRIYE